MNIALDIDDTITKSPSFFSLLSRSVRREGCRIYIITSRSNVDSVKEQTRQELLSYGVEFDELHVISNKDTGHVSCPYEELDWYQKYLWQKVSFCLDKAVSIVFEDDQKVIDLFKKYAPNIQVFQVR